MSELSSFRFWTERRRAFSLAIALMGGDRRSYVQ